MSVGVVYEPVRKRLIRLSGFSLNGGLNPRYVYLYIE